MHLLGNDDVCCRQSVTLRLGPGWGMYRSPGIEGPQHLNTKLGSELVQTQVPQSNHKSFSAVGHTAAPLLAWLQKWANLICIASAACTIFHSKPLVPTSSSLL